MTTQRSGDQEKGELKPCPFCGAEAYAFQAAGGAWFVSCGSDRKDEEGCWHQQHRTGGMTPEAWNRRPSPEPEPVRGGAAERLKDDAYAEGFRAGLKHAEDTKAVWISERVREGIEAALSEPVQELQGVDLGELEKVARAATSGPWIVDGGSVIISTAPWPIDYGPSWQDWETRGGEPLGRFVAETRTAETEGESNAAFLSTFDPPTVIKLITALRALSPSSGGNLQKMQSALGASQGSVTATADGGAT